MSERHAGIEVGKSDASRTILWFHGYTGSPDAFAPTAQRLAEALDARVLIPLLPGHGTEESHLPEHQFADFTSSAQHFFDHALERQKPLALMGYSFGGYLAMMLAAQHEPEALVLALTPYRVRFPLWVPGISWILDREPFWGKHLTQEDVRLRKGTFYYPDLPGKSLSLIEEGNSKAAVLLPKITCPIITLHNGDDPLAAPQSGEALLYDSGKNPENVSRVFPNDRHTFFMGKDRERDENVVIEFLARQFKKETAAMREHDDG